MKNNKIDKIIESFRNYRNFKEEIANVVGTGNIAGTPEADPGNPPVFKKKKKNRYIFQQGLRKWWKQNTQ